MFGLQIAVLACGWGLTTRGGPKEVGTSTTGAVVMTLVTVSLMDVLHHSSLFSTYLQSDPVIICQKFIYFIVKYFD